ncbi:CLUMA_CG001988, isoform A [Clunio marinus]|uniref:PRA1 family protein n=1 Tax=Clunio marinus TaxID=568069 RepID=A0A1J1HJJ4_9DIPT|nr:CLUMA_CG001988, isoform A [Clunio marinus]
MSQTTMNNFQFAPLRSLDDFILESARFQIPTFSDFEKWGNRVVKNLLYYQTNYFILSAIELIIIGLIQPMKIVLGAVAIAAVFYAVLMIYGPNKSASTQQLQSVNKYAVLGLLLGIAYIFLYMFDAVLLVAFAVLLPISSIFIHSSLRLRNLKNKLTTTVETIGIKHSPMGQLLEALGLMPDTFQ